MDTKALEKFCPWARVELIDAVHMRCVRYALDDAGRAATPADADIVKGAVLSAAEKAQRAALFSRIEAQGYTAFCEQQAYRWFNRFAAIRFMELHGYLDHGMRILSATDGSFSPECLQLASELDLPGLDQGEVLRLITTSQGDEELFRLILVAQMNDLARCLPTVFGHVDEADALTLPDNLLARGEHDVLFHLVTDIPEPCWDDVEVLGWMYQFYNAELKDAFFKSKRKAAVADLAPATQLFTPNWIVRYMVENSLGRLWMLNNPGSRLREHMDYYIEPDSEHEDFIRIDGPEDITFCDPACGSGHILVYAFSLLHEMYVERGYREREIPTLILTKNLAGMEIDERAAQIAALALALCAREHDRRFFTRDVVADIHVLESVELGEDGAPKALAARAGLVETLAHLSEVGSLFAPDAADLAAIDTALAELAGDSLFGASLRDQLANAKQQLEALARTFNVVVANPPYMGGSSFNPFMSEWMKKHYPDSCKDLCTAFIERGYSLAKKQGYAAMVTMQSWMFLGSFEKMRNELIDDKAIVTMAHLGPRAFDAIGGEVVSVTADVLYNGNSTAKGTYFRLVDIIGSEPKRAALVEAIQNPDCGWFYRADATTFRDIPGSPIAYWIGVGMRNSFLHGSSISSISDYTGSQNKTGDNATYLRYSWEIGSETVGRGKHWAPYSKGGDYRRWYGNLNHLVDISHEALAFYATNPTSNCLADRYWFSQGICYTMLTSGKPSFRLWPGNGGFDMAGPVICSLENNLNWCLGFLNSSAVASMLGMMNPTLNLQAKDVKNLPLLFDENNRQQVDELANQCICMSQIDWDTQETSWDFKRNPLI